MVYWLHCRSDTTVAYCIIRVSAVDEIIIMESIGKEESASD